MSRADDLAADFERDCTAFADYVASLSPEQWRAIAVNHPEIVQGGDENRPVGVVAHHVGDMIPTLTEIARRRACGEQTPSIDVNTVNARHAAVNPKPDQAETVTLLRDNGARAAEVIRELSDDSLDRAGAESRFTAEQVIRRVLIGHFAMHQGSIQATVGSFRGMA